MAKRTHTIKAAFLAVATAARAEASGTLTAEEKSKAVNKAMDVLEDSDAVTVMEKIDEGIEQEMEAEALAAAEEMQLLGEPEPD